MKATCRLAMGEIRHKGLPGDVDHQELVTAQSSLSRNSLSGPSIALRANGHKRTKSDGNGISSAPPVDPLIPRHADVERVFHASLETWRQFHHHAAAALQTASQQLFPPGLKPAIMHDLMPPLPDALPARGVLVGAPTWLIPEPEHEPEPESQPEPEPKPAPDCDAAASSSASSPASRPDLDLNQVAGLPKYFRLAYPAPLACRVSGDPAMHHYQSPPPGLAIFALGWSYVFSTRLLQLQHRRPRYTAGSCIRPIPAPCVGPVEPDEVVVPLPASASHRLVHWLCAILAPESGWEAADDSTEDADAASENTARCTPWHASCGAGDVRFVVSTASQVYLDPTDPAPSADEALELLLEFCDLFGLGHDDLESDGPQPLSPIKAGFMAALAIPFYRMAKLQPRFPCPVLTPREANSPAPLNDDQKDSIRDWLDDARYLMTLSMQPYVLSSVLWSVFYQPAVPCNLVSPWMTSILTVLAPALKTGDYPLLAAIFTLRRPRVGLWWLGLFLLGDPRLLNLIISYLTTLNEGLLPYDTLSRPDVVTALWTGASQSYQDDPDTYRPVIPATANFVPRVTLLQHRHTLTLRDPYPLFTPWRPFGALPRIAVEPDLYPWLERGHRRRYLRWKWWVKDDSSFKPVTYTRSSSASSPVVPDRLTMLPCTEPPAPLPHGTTIDPTPSIVATRAMIAHSLGTIMGERVDVATVIPGLTDDHPWLRDWTP